MLLITAYAHFILLFYDLNNIIFMQWLIYGKILNYVKTKICLNLKGFTVFMFKENEYVLFCIAYLPNRVGFIVCKQ